jgi:hypothetical protein
MCSGDRGRYVSSRSSPSPKRSRASRSSCMSALASASCIFVPDGPSAAATHRAVRVVATPVRAPPAPAPASALRNRRATSRRAARQRCQLSHRLRRGARARHPGRASRAPRRGSRTRARDERASRIPARSGVRRAGEAARAPNPRRAQPASRRRGGENPRSRRAPKDAGESWFSKVGTDEMDASRALLTPSPHVPPAPRGFARARLARPAHSRARPRASLAAFSRPAFEVVPPIVAILGCANTSRRASVTPLARDALGGQVPAALAG